MAERGTLQSRHVGEILEDLHYGKKTGRLRFSRKESKVFKDVWFEAGEIVSSGTNEPREYLGQYLIASGKITEKDFVRAYATQTETKVLFGKVLAMFGIVTESEVATALKGKTEESVWDVFLWPDGVWEFDETAALMGQRLPMKVDVPALVAEGERRVLDWSVIRQVLPDFHFEAEVPPLPAGASKLAGRDEMILAGLSQAKPPGEVVLELRLSPYQFLQRVHELQKRGRLVVKRKPPSPVAVAIDEVLDVVEVDVDAFADRVDPARLFKVSPAGEEVAVGELRRRIPVLARSKADLMKQAFSAEEGYLLSRVDGVYDVATVASLCPFRETLALERLSELAARGILHLQNP